LRAAPHRRLQDHLHIPSRPAVVTVHPGETAALSRVILASVLIIVAYAVLGWAVAFRNQQSAITISNITAMRFTPIGLFVISTVLHNQRPARRTGLRN
jgi:hypothetical protein